MMYETDEIIEASVTKSRPGQKIGLGLEEKNCKSLCEDDDENDDDDNNKIVVVTEIGGLFKKQKLPIRAGDVLLEVNSIPVTNKGQFPNGLKDIRKFLKGTWSIRVKVGRNHNCSDGGETSATEEVTQKSYLEFDSPSQQSQQPEDSGHRRYDTDASEHHHRTYETEDDSGHRMYDTDASGHHRYETGDEQPPATDAPKSKKRRGRRNRKKETLGTLIRETRSQTPSDRRRGTRRGKRPSKPKGEQRDANSGHSRSHRKTRERELDSGHTRSTVCTEADSLHSRSVSKRTVESRIGADAHSDHSRSRSNRKIEYRAMKEVDSGHSVSNHRTMETRVSAEVDSCHSRSTSTRKNGHHLLMKMKEERRKNSSNNDNFASHTRSISFRTNEPEASSYHSRSASNRTMMEPTNQCPNRTLDGNRAPVNNSKDAEQQQQQQHRISGVECTDGGVTLELNDGNRVSIEPNQLMNLVSEENGKFVAVSQRNPTTAPIPPSFSKSIRQLSIIDSDDGSISKDDKSMEVPTLQDLRNLLKKKNSSWDTDENTPILPDVRNLLENAPGDMSIENLVKENPWAKTSLMSILEEHSDIDSTRNVAATAQQHPTSLSLRNLLGKRLQTTNPKKWEESSMISSTLACMTNLIDPGDLMKIRNFASRPHLNGATVEIVKKTEAMYGYNSDNNRWDVKIIQRKNQSPDDAVQDPNRFISVAAENLKHFV